MGFTPHSVIIMTSRRIVDSHFHIFDISVRNSFPHQNSSHGFPGEDQVEINRSHTIEEAETTLASSGIKTGVFVQCYNDCPEEMDWVFSQAEKHTFLKGVVGGLDLTKHDKMKAAIAKFSQNKRPKFVGVRHLIDFEDKDFLTCRATRQPSSTSPSLLTSSPSSRWSSTTSPSPTMSRMGLSSGRRIWPRQPSSKMSTASSVDLSTRSPSGVSRASNPTFTTASLCSECLVACSAVTGRYASWPNPLLTTRRW